MTKRLRDRYELLDVLGKGGEGRVIKAVDHLHDRMVAIKVRSAATSEQQGALLQEARTLLNLEPHRGLSVVRDDFFLEDSYYMVMDWIEGTNLQTVLERKGDPGLPYDTVLGHLSDVARALDHLHAQDPPVMHLDVKPANLVLTERGRVVLVDFGIASSDKAKGGGTSGFMAPELAGGSPPTRAADVFGLAATAHALLTGSPPRGRRAVWRNVPSDQLDNVKETLERGLSIDPERRPRSASDLVEELGGQGIAEREAKAPLASRSRTREERAGEGTRTLIGRNSLVAIVILVLALSATTLLLTSPWSNGALDQVPLNSVGRISADGHAIEDAVAVGTQPTRVAVGEGAVWVSNLKDQTVSRIDPVSGEVERVIAAGGTPSDIAVGEQAVWVANEFDGTVTQIDPVSNAAAMDVELSFGCRDVAVGEGAVWVTNVTDETLTKLDPQTLETLDSIRLPGKPEDVTVGYGAVWVADSSNRILLRIDPTGLRLERIGLRTVPTAVTAGHESIWTASSGEDQVTRINPESRSTASIRVGNSPAEIGAGSESGIWVANYLDGTVSHIDPSSGRVVATVEVGNAPEGIAVEGDNVWVSVHTR